MDSYFFGQRYSLAVLHTNTFALLIGFEHCQYRIELRAQPPDFVIILGRFFQKGATDFIIGGIDPYLRCRVLRFLTAMANRRNLTVPI